MIAKLHQRIQPVQGAKFFNRISSVELASRPTVIRATICSRRVQALTAATHFFDFVFIPIANLPMNFVLGVSLKHQGDLDAFKAASTESAAPCPQAKPCFFVVPSFTKAPVFMR
ncbi:MAG: hypothetical protein WD046_03035 [Paracoccaceae bacterium]